MRWITGTSAVIVMLDAILCHRLHPHATPTGPPNHGHDEISRVSSRWRVGIDWGRMDYLMITSAISLGASLSLSLCSVRYDDTS